MVVHNRSVDRHRAGGELRCPRCDTENREGRRFCAECGAALPVACPQCGFVNSADEKFCGGCGSAVAAAKPAFGAVAALPSAAVGERRPVTILFADLANYTRLSSERDPEETHRLLGSFFEVADAIVQRFGGAIDKHIGDNVMAIFGAPLAHGDDPERAVRAAFAIHQAMVALSLEIGVELAVHCGVASGEVVASGLGSAHHREYTVTGDAVNLAARLQGAAGSGETLISDAVHQAVERSMTCEDCGEIAVKGIVKPVRIWRAAALLAIREGGTSAFVGREADLDRLRLMIADCRACGRGAVVHLRGDAGIGKTRLIEQFCRLAEAEGYACHVGHVLDFGVGRDRDAIRTIVASLLALAPGSAEVERLRAAFGAEAEGLIAAPQRGFLNDLLDLPQHGELQVVYEAMDNAARNRGKQQTVASLVEKLSARRPLALVVEDIHWADRLALAYLAALAGAVVAVPALLIMTSRIEGDPLDENWRAAAQGRSIVTIDLAPLRHHEALALASGFISTTNRFALRCIERAAGNPLFLEQLLRNAEAGEESDVPPSIHSLVVARMDRLAPRDKASLQAASIVGQRFALDVVRALVGDETASVDSLLAHNLVRPVGEEYLFAHALIRDGVYSSLTRTRRRQLHRAAAEWYGRRDLVLRAAHLDRAEDDAAPRAYLEAAVDQERAYHQERALVLVQRGLVLAKSLADRHDLAALGGELLREAGQGRESLEAYRRALDAAGDEAERCAALIGIAAANRLITRVDDALAALAEAEPTACARGDDRSLAEIHYYRGNLYFARGRIEECRAEHDAALAGALRAGDPEWEARAISGLADAAYLQGRMRTALGHFRRCIALCDANGFGRIAIANRVMVGHSRAYLNEFKDGLRDMHDGIEAALRVGNRHAEMFARQSTGLLLTLCGDYAAAALVQPLALEQARQLGARRYEAIILAHQAEATLALNGRDEARALAEQAVALSRDTGAGFCGPLALSVLARATDDPSTRAAALREGAAILAGGCVSHNHFWFHRNAIELALQGRDWDEIDRHADALAAYTQAERLPFSDLLAARGHVLAAFGRGASGPDLAATLSRLRDEALAAGIKMALPALDAALSVA
jgi:class 3 adenylate cyclase/tetratricopeptide (TPR) repeat protein